MCDSEYDKQGLPIGAYDNIAENIANNNIAENIANNKLAQSAAKRNAVETSEPYNVRPRSYVNLKNEPGSPLNYQPVLNTK